MKPFKKFLCCLFALVLSGVCLYTELLFSFPSEITMLENELHKTKLGAGVFIGETNAVCTRTSGSVTPLESGEYEAVLKLGGALPYKKVTLKVEKPRTVCASGGLIGIRIHNKGLIVTSVDSITSGGNSVSPSKDAGIEKGDIILEINGVAPSGGDDVGKLLTDRTSVKILHGNSVRQTTVTPARDDTDNALKLGIWVRDSTAGVGTLTFYDRKSGWYGALGHGISDSDTGVLFDVSKGTIEKSSVVSVKKGTAGTPGEICGSFASARPVLGTVDKNCETGIFGKLPDAFEISGKSYPIGVMSQVTEGDATILSTVGDTTAEYNIRIIHSMPFGSATKGLMIEITDPTLLSQTGGIVQGMSGSPIVQNGKLVGAVTHVLVNDPTKGYGIFIENMLKEIQ